VIDQLREQIEKRLAELADEEKRLREALGALGHRAAPTRVVPTVVRRVRAVRPGRAAKAAPEVAARVAGEAVSAAKSVPARRSRRRAQSSSSRASARATKATPEALGTAAVKEAPAPKPAPARRSRQRAQPSSGRNSSGATKAAVLAALEGGEALTAGEVAAKAGLERRTVASTLTRLVKSGEVAKAERGYRLAS
jgi:hypothetical protein